MTLCYENKNYVLDNPISEVDEMTVTPEELSLHTQHTGDATKVTCIMVATMLLELQKLLCEGFYRL